MKKILFVLSAIIAMTFASCTRCSTDKQVADQDTTVVYDTIVYETTDTVFAE